MQKPLFPSRMSTPSQSPRKYTPNCNPNCNPYNIAGHPPKMPKNAVAPRAEDAEAGPVSRPAPSAEKEDLTRCGRGKTRRRRGLGHKKPNSNNNMVLGEAPAHGLAQTEVESAQAYKNQSRSSRLVSPSVNLSAVERHEPVRTSSLGAGRQEPELVKVIPNESRIGPLVDLSEEPPKDQGFPPVAISSLLLDPSKGPDDQLRDLSEEPTGDLIDLSEDRPEDQGFSPVVISSLLLDPSKGPDDQLRDLCEGLNDRLIDLSEEPDDQSSHRLVISTTLGISRGFSERMGQMDLNSAFPALIPANLKADAYPASAPLTPVDHYGSVEARSFCLLTPSSSNSRSTSPIDFYPSSSASTISAPSRRPSSTTLFSSSPPRVKSPQLAADKDTLLRRSQVILTFNEGVPDYLWVLAAGRINRQE